jgi:hypothetical protein
LPTNQSEVPANCDKTISGRMKLLFFFTAKLFFEIAN